MCKLTDPGIRQACLQACRHAGQVAVRRATAADLVAHEDPEGLAARHVWLDCGDERVGRILPAGVQRVLRPIEYIGAELDQDLHLPLLRDRFVVAGVDRIPHDVGPAVQLVSRAAVKSHHLEVRRFARRCCRGDPAMEEVRLEVTLAVVGWQRRGAREKAEPRQAPERHRVFPTFSG